MYKTIICFLLLIVAIKALSQKQRFDESLTKNFVINENTVLNIKNKFGNISIDNWDKNELYVVVTISIYTNNVELTSEYFNNFDVQIKNDSSNIYLNTFINEEKLDSSFKNKNSRFEVNYKIIQPRYLNTNIQNSNGDIEINELTNKLNIELEYGILKCQNLNFSETKPLNSVKLSYAKAEITAVSFCDFDLSYSTLIVKNATSLYTNSKNSNIQIDNAYSLISKSTYDDFKLGNLSRLAIYSKYSNISCNYIEKQITFDLTYGNCSINLVDNFFELIKIKSNYTDIKCLFNSDICYNISANITNGKITLPLKKNINKHIATNNIQIDGVIGCNNDSKSKVEIESSNGYIKLF